MLDRGKLAQAVKNKLDYDTQILKTAKEIGVSRSTFYRAIGGLPLSMENGFKILLWLDVPLEELKSDYKQ